MKTNPNEQAFAGNADGAREHMGLTKREYFAALCMQSAIISANSKYQSEPHDSMNKHKRNVSEYAVGMADALIAELNKEVK